MSNKKDIILANIKAEIDKIENKKTAKPLFNWTCSFFDFVQNDHNIILDFVQNTH